MPPPPSHAECLLGEGDQLGVARQRQAGRAELRTAARRRPRRGVGDRHAARQGRVAVGRVVVVARQQPALRERARQVLRVAAKVADPVRARAPNSMTCPSRTRITMIAAVSK